MEIKKILLIDDSQPFNYISRIILDENNVLCKVDEVLHGKLALEYLVNTDECPDVILLDIRMPVMDGFEFLKEYENLGKCQKTKIFMLSSSTREEDIKAASDNKLVNGYFDKPLSSSHVEQILAAFK